MPKYFVLLAISGLISLSSCDGGEKQGSSEPKKVEAEPAVNLSNMDWLIGSWIGQLDSTTTTEIWNKTNNQKFIGRSGMIVENDTNYFEKLTLEVIDGEVYYIADVAENKEAVSFKLISTRPNHFIFENAEHDFPQRIIYTFNEPNDLRIELKGKVDSVRKEMEIFYKKVN